RWEPNGGVWVECDCNLTGGEYMIRQFLWGQRFTREYFGYTSDCFWLPDTFGYSFALPQIIKGCGVQYFLTTKMDWNDTTKFPYTSFLWQGLDGTRVLTHLNRIEQAPSPKWLARLTTGEEKIKEPWVSNMRLHSYGHGDGGGGPHEAMIEMSRRVTDLEGVARSKHLSVSAFMHKLEDTIVRPSVYADELYLEGHRGTLTNQHRIKRNNRKAEIALHDLELALVLRAVQSKAEASGEAVRPLLNDLLVRQFHDILPGTCIHAAHEEALAVVGNVIETATQLTKDTLQTSGGGVTLLNTLGFPRGDTLYLPAKAAGVAGSLSQAFTNPDGEHTLAVSGIALPAIGGAALMYTDTPCAEPSPFMLDGDRLTTPFAAIRFDENGFIASMTDTHTGRELVKGLPFNTFLLAEDVPARWDAWDVDADLHEKFKPCAQLLSREAVSDGPVELRIRSTYKISEKSTITQDMVFSAASPLISFDIVMDWQEEHAFLKTAFDTAMHCDGARSEIQFGHIRRTNQRSTDAQKAKHEVCNHKFTDLSEASYGVAILNDCKYGLSVLGGSMRLSLHKGGMRPDKYGDKGHHRCRYALLPHAAPFDAESVIRPAYAFNYEPVLLDGNAELPALAAADRPNILIETVKPCEDAQCAYILRLYEAMGDYTTTKLSFSHGVTGVKECNMLEEEQSEADAASLTFRPFEIKTLKVSY
ncbi:MAG: alpha-mannosidase, partial [Clostridiales bacterium]|nr:alpha-mannosidase [Clostridiales bacterium]